MSGVKLEMWEVVGCVGSLRFPLETRGVGCQDRGRRTGGGEEVVLKRNKGISTIL